MIDELALLEYANELDFNHAALRKVFLRVLAFLQ